MIERHVLERERAGRGKFELRKDPDRQILVALTRRVNSTSRNASRAAGARGSDAALRVSEYLDGDVSDRLAANSLIAFELKYSGD
jgi:hypothetical protein